MEVHYATLFLNASGFFALMFLYAGPDQILPLMSVLAAVFGVLLVFWQRFVGFLRRSFQFFTKRRRPIVKKKA